MSERKVRTEYKKEIYVPSMKIIIWTDSSNQHVNLELKEESAGTLLFKHASLYNEETVEEIKKALDEAVEYLIQKGINFSTFTYKGVA